MRVVEIEIQLNGIGTLVPSGLTIAGLLHHLELDQGRVAVELDRHIVRKNDWDIRQVVAGSQVEVVHFVGGGLSCAGS